MKTAMERSWALSLVLVALLLSASMVAGATGNFVTVTLPKGVSIDLPKNWVVLSNNQRITLDTSVESRLDLSGIRQQTSKLPFAANYYDDRGNVIGILNVRYYPQLDLSQADAFGATNQDVQELDAALRENMFKEMKAFGMSITSWSGTTKTAINGITAFITEYRRAPLKGSGDFRVRLVRVLVDDRSFTLTVSYLDSASMFLRPITDRIIGSLKLTGIAVSKSPTASASVSETPGLWSNTSEGFGAMFPETPEKISSTTGQLAGYAYQSSKNFTSGGALYSITVVPLPAEIKKANFNSFLKMSNDAFLKSMGQDPNSAKVNWSNFGDGRKKLAYDFRFGYSGIPFRERGFWIIDRGRTIRVSVAFTESLTSKDVRQVLLFLESFFIVTK